MKMNFVVEVQWELLCICFCNICLGIIGEWFKEVVLYWKVSVIIGICLVIDRSLTTVDSIYDVIMFWILLELLISFEV